MIDQKKEVKVIDIEEKPSYEKLELMTGSVYTKEQIAVIANTVAKGCSATELGHFLSVAKHTNLNPFMKEIWCYKDKVGNLIIMAGRDGFLHIAQRSPRWTGMISSEVYENDFFEVDVIKGEVQHRPNYKDRGNILGAYCIIRPKGIEHATYEWAAIKDYDKGQFIWNSHKNEMIKKVAEVHALKKAFGIGSLYCAEEIIEINFDEKLEKVVKKIDGNDDSELIQEIKDAIELCKDRTDIKNLLKQHSSFIGSKADLMQMIAKKKESFDIINSENV